MLLQSPLRPKQFAHAWITFQVPFQVRQKCQQFFESDSEAKSQVSLWFKSTGTRSIQFSFIYFLHAILLNKPLYKTSVYGRKMWTDALHADRGQIIKQEGSSPISPTLHKMKDYSLESKMKQSPPQDPKHFFLVETFSLFPSVSQFHDTTTRGVEMFNLFFTLGSLATQIKTL